MYFPSLKEFLRLSRKGNVIPVYSEVNADLETPVSAFLKIAKGDYGFLLESVEGQEKVARYSFLGGSPATVFKSQGRQIQLEYPGKRRRERFLASGSALDELGKIMRRFRPAMVKGLPRFCGGMVGYFGYDTVRFFERLPEKNPALPRLPDAVLILSDTLLIFDHINQTIKIIANVILPEKGRPLCARERLRLYRQATAKIQAIQRQLRLPLPRKAHPAPGRRAGAISSNLSKTAFMAKVREAKEYIRKGDIIQVVLSQRFALPCRRDPFDVYRSLRGINPSPYMFFLKFKGLALAGSSPEMLVRCEDGCVETRPIAGTRPRGRSETEDAKLAAELARDKKERAEHLMLVDLGRNDLGRVCKNGSVKVAEFMQVERYSHVMHLVTSVKGKLDNKRYNAYDVLRACFPAGTVSGSPKIRAMEIIEELENLRRGPYAGCVGYFGFSGNMDTCITIRTIAFSGGKAYAQAGAGIVADSVPAREYQETVNKAKALLEAIIKSG
jgi:anthranilate synthase component 1